jgi:hypothetical protein
MKDPAEKEPFYQQIKVHFENAENMALFAKRFSEKFPEFASSLTDGSKHIWWDKNGPRVVTAAKRDTELVRVVRETAAYRKRQREKTEEL